MFKLLKTIRFGDSTHSSYYALDGNFFKIVLHSSGHYILKKLYFNLIYLPLRTYKTNQLAVDAIFDHCNIKLCVNCKAPLVKDVFGLYCPYEDCNSMGLPEKKICPYCHSTMIKDDCPNIDCMTNTVSHVVGKMFLNET